MFDSTGACLARHSSNLSGCEQLSKCRTNCISRTAVDSCTSTNFLYIHRRPSRRRHICPWTRRPVIDRRGMMTVQRCQTSALVGRGFISRIWRYGRLSAIMAGLVSDNDDTAQKGKRQNRATRLRKWAQMRNPDLESMLLTRIVSITTHSYAWGLIYRHASAHSQREAPRNLVLRIE
jgi:hypothetical protein